MVELAGASVGNAGRFGEGLDGHVGVLEERDGAVGPEVEEVVTELRCADGGGEPCSEDTVVEANGRVHVVRDECEVVDPTPRWRGRLFGLRVLGNGHD